MPTTKSEFIISCTRQLLKDDISVFLHQKQSVETYGGWFDGDENKEFVVALKNPMGFEIFIHEYCHYLQWKNDKPLWNQSMDTYDTLFNWIDQKESDYENSIGYSAFKTQDLDKSLHDIIVLEHDCEKRVLHLMTNNTVDGFDFDKYIRAANCYLFHYHINREIRKRPLSPIYKDEILKNMPNTFSKDVNYYLDKNNISSLMRETFLTEYN
jgi:hypothetical protein